MSLPQSLDSQARLDAQHQLEHLERENAALRQQLPGLAKIAKPQQRLTSIDEIEEALRLPHKRFEVLRTIVELTGSKYIDMTARYSQQAVGLIDGIVSAIRRETPVFERYEDAWPIRIMLELEMDLCRQSLERALALEREAVAEEHAARQHHPPHTPAKRPLSLNLRAENQPTPSKRLNLELNSDAMETDGLLFALDDFLSLSTLPATSPGEPMEILFSGSSLDSFTDATMNAGIEDDKQDYNNTVPPSSVEDFGFLLDSFAIGSSDPLFHLCYRWYNNSCWLDSSLTALYAIALRDLHMFETMLFSLQTRPTAVLPPNHTPSARRRGSASAADFRSLVDVAKRKGLQFEEQFYMAFGWLYDATAFRAMMAVDGAERLSVERAISMFRAYVVDPTGRYLSQNGPTRCSCSSSSFLRFKGKIERWFREGLLTPGTWAMQRCWREWDGERVCNGSAVFQPYVLSLPTVLIIYIAESDKHDWHIPAELLPLDNTAAADGVKYEIVAQIYSNGGHYITRYTTPDGDIFDYDGLRHGGRAIQRVGFTLERSMTGLHLSFKMYAPVIRSPTSSTDSSEAKPRSVSFNNGVKLIFPSTSISPPIHAMATTFLARLVSTHPLSSG
ncbi:hypothetical protein C8F01DRAFT_1338655 [Mycena amicta]|nr:hypothetical protein C8F01DRAFT_1338655 [Mycena amicta]